MATRKRPILPATEDEMREIRAAAHAVWEEIASDIFGEESASSIPRSEVIELVADANRLGDMLKRRGKLNALLISKIDSYLYEVEPIVKAAFPYARYS